MPMAGGYWLWPARMASTAASSTEAGPSVSGKPWPRLIEPVATARADISPKMVEPKPRMRSTTWGAIAGRGGSVMRGSYAKHPLRPAAWERDRSRRGRTSRSAGGTDQQALGARRLGRPRWLVRHRQESHDDRIG